ncbi:MAG: hypothetical protein P4L49_11805 [Desulfosporosinus sp.]|nr:hypothetical protein [Desulfosporosinus sp.]
MISEKFTIDDIHLIRYENYAKTKDMKQEELIEKTRRDAMALVEGYDGIHLSTDLSDVLFGTPNTELEVLVLPCDTMKK